MSNRIKAPEIKGFTLVLIFEYSFKLHLSKAHANLREFSNITGSENPSLHSHSYDYQYSFYTDK